MKNEAREICLTAVKEYGSGAQIEKAKEELFELGTALSHFQQGRATTDEVVTEIADVTIMALQLALIFGENEVSEEMRVKLERLVERMRLPVKENPALVPEPSKFKHYYYGN